MNKILNHTASHKLNFHDALIETHSSAGSVEEPTLSSRNEQNPYRIIESIAQTPKSKGGKMKNSGFYTYRKKV